MSPQLALQGHLQRGVLAIPGASIWEHCWRSHADFSIQAHFFVRTGVVVRRKTGTIRDSLTGTATD